jgi:hypothetical protein
MMKIIGSLFGFKLLILLSKVLLFFGIVSLIISCKEKVNEDFTPTVEVKYSSGKASLMKDGKPYQVIGGSGFEQMERLIEFGGNSIRTWNAENAEKILDEALENGLTVILGLGIGKEYWGDDFNYYNFSAVNRKIDEIIKTVEKYKNHPALLMWGVGNEVSLFGGNRFIVYYTINRIAKRIKEMDPNHPVMTAINVSSQKDRYAIANWLLTDVDILGYNAFERLPLVYEKVYGSFGWKKPYIFSEWGPTGHWETYYTDWGAPKEMSSTDKAKMMKDSWEIIRKNDDLFLGSYAFYWGFKYEITHTWFSLFSEEGYESESINFLKGEWTGNEVENWAPQIEALIIDDFRDIDNIYLVSDSTYRAKIYVSDPENDDLAFKWEIRHEESNFYDSGKFKYDLGHLIESDSSDYISFKSPNEIGGYRLFVFVYDGKNNFASHNIPFYVIKQ